MVWDVLTNGGVTRRQPMVLQITTAGFDPETICGEQYSYCKALVDGDVDDDAYFFWWVEPPADADHRDPAVIEAANPSFGHIMQIDYYLDQLTKKTEAVFRRYFLNQWTESEESWLGSGIWEALAVGPFEFDPDLPTWTGTDVATKNDSTAHVRGQWHDCTPGCPGWRDDDAKRFQIPLGAPLVVRKLRLSAKLWERPFDPRTRRPKENWRLPIAEVDNELRAYHRSLTLEACGYDPARFERSAQQLAAEGLPMEEVPQTDSRMVPAAMTLYELTMQGLVEHDGDKAFTRHMKNAVAVQVQGGNGGWRLSKGKAKRKMDAAIGAAIVALLASQPVEHTPAPATVQSKASASDLFRPKERLRL